jgi:hypothetical protein
MFHYTSAFAGGNRDLPSGCESATSNLNTLPLPRLACTLAVLHMRASDEDCAQADVALHLWQTRGLHGMVSVE